MEDKNKLQKGDVKRFLRYRTEDTVQKFKKNKISYLFVAPFFVVFFLFYVLPVIISIGLSFTFFNVLEPPKFIGWQNYINLFFSDDVFLIAVKNTFLLAILTGPLGFMASLLFAWFINELPQKLRSLMVVIFYAPTISGQVYIVWAVLFNGDIYGYANGLLMKLGLISQPIQWLTDTKYIMPICVVVILWMSMGAGFLSFVAGLQTVDRSMYEAGYVDGIRNRWQELWFLTLPSMKPQLMFGAVMTVSGSFAIHEALVPLAGFPSVDYAVHTVVSHLVDYGSIRFEMGYASAIATLLFVVMILSNKLIQALLKRVGR